MTRTFFIILFIFSFSKQYAQDTIFYVHNNLETYSNKKAKYYGLFEYPTADSNQKILTKYYKNGKPISRTFYFDYENRIKHNIQMLFRSNGQLAKTISYNFDTLQGPTVEYNKVGVMISKKDYYKGKLYKLEENENAIDTTEVKLPPHLDLPIQPGCQKYLDSTIRSRCTYHNIYRIISNHLIYPEKAIEEEIIGVLVMKLYINKNGKITDSEIAGKSLESDIFDSCAYNAVKNIPQFYAASQYGENIDYNYTFPIRFNLDNINSDLSQNTFYDVDETSPASQREFRERGIKTQNVDRMPIWNGCHLRGYKETEDDCTEWRIERFIRKNVIYPKKYKNQDLSEILIVRFTVDTTGSVCNIRISNKSLIKEFNEGAEAVIKQLPPFIPAKKDNTPVPFDFSVAVKFRYR